MRLTTPLGKTPLRWLLKKEWARKSTYIKPTPSVPAYYRLKGVPIINAADEYLKPKREIWVSPVPDDPRWAAPVAKQQHPDWNDTPIHEFNSACRLLEGTTQALILTKTQTMHGQPQDVTDLVGQVSIPNQDELVQRYIMQAYHWDTMKEKIPKRNNPDLPIWKFKTEFGIKKERSIHILLSNILRLFHSSLAGRYPDVTQGRRHLFEHYTSVMYDFSDKPIQLRFLVECLISGRSPLVAFADTEAVDATTSHKMADLYPVAPTIDLLRQHIYRVENITGFREGFSHVHPHTLVVNDNEEWSSDQLQARSLLYCFATAAAHAKSKYGWDVNCLPEPVAVQCIRTNGTHFHFTYFQLNTLDLTSGGGGEGIKNMVWFDADNVLFQRTEPKRSMLRNTKYEDYDPHVLEKILAVYLNGVKLLS